MSRKERRAAGLGGEAEAAIAAQGQGAAGAAFIGAAIVGALVERGAVDPMEVVRWAEMFLQDGAVADSPMTKATIDGFCDLLKSMATMPAGAGRG